MSAFRSLLTALLRVTCRHQWETRFRGMPGIPFTYAIKKCTKCGAENTK